MTLRADPGQTDPGVLLVACGSGDDLAAVNAVVPGRVQLYFCACARELLRHELLSEDSIGRVRGVLLDLDMPGARATLPVLVARLKGTPVPLLLRLSLRSTSIRAAVAHAASLSDLRLSLRQCDSLVADVEHLVSFVTEQVAGPLAKLAIISRSAVLVTKPTLPIVAAAAAIGARPVSVGVLARVSRLGVRTLESRLATAGAMAPKPLLQWMLALHAAWSICVAGNKASSVAETIGLPSTDALSGRVERVTGLRLRVLCEGEGFDGLLERFSELFVGDRRGANGTSRVF